MSSSPLAKYFRSPIPPSMIKNSKSWVSSLGLFGVSAGVMLLFMLEYQPVLKFVPVYNRKFKGLESEEEK